MVARRNHLSVAQKTRLQLYYRAHPKLTHEDLMRWAQANLGVLVARSTIGGILRAPLEGSLNPRARSRNQGGRYPDMERQLYAFVLAAPDLGKLSELALCAKANDLLRAAGRTETVSKSWVFRFKQRHALAALRRLRKSIEDYEPCDVFSLDETALFFRARPERKQPTTQACVAVGLCANMDGSEKLEPVVLHCQTTTQDIPQGLQPEIQQREQRPCVIDGVDVSELPVRLYSNAQPWMTGSDFSDWLTAFNQRMHGRRVLLLLDDAPCHGAEISLSNVRVLFLPPGSPTRLQPMRAGITLHFKLQFKLLGLQWILDQQRAADVNTEMKHMGLLTAVHHIVQAWQQVPPHSIRNCWAHTGVVSGSLVTQLQQQNVPKQVLDVAMLDWLITQLAPSEPLTATEFLSVEDDVAEWAPDDVLVTARTRRPYRRREQEEAKGDGTAETLAKTQTQECKPLSHGQALDAAMQLSTYAFAQGIEAPDLAKLIEIARERCRGGSSV